MEKNMNKRWKLCFWVCRGIWAQVTDAGFRAQDLRVQGLGFKV